MADKDHFVRITPRGEIQAPVEYRDEVEAWARRNGRHADLVFVPPINAWQVRLSPMPNDPRLIQVQQGKLPESDLWENIELLDPVSAEERRKDPNLGFYKPINLHELGIDGLIALLDRGNMWTKRGEFNSIQEALVASRERQRREQEKLRRTLSETTKDIALEVRRVVNKIPFFRTGVDLSPSSEAPTRGAES